jgi:predicted DNA-binding protein (MmcQ/YjbR family)
MLTQSTLDKRRERLVRLCTALPEAEVELWGNRHLAFRVRKKTFAYYWNSHHDDGIVALCCKVHAGDQALLVGLDPQLFYIPPYLGANGWIGFRLDRSRVDWDRLAELVRISYRLTAPKKLAAQTG